MNLMKLSRYPSAFIRIQQFHSSVVCDRKQSGRYKVTLRQDFPLTYEMANPPYQIGHRKSWNSWNTCNLWEGLRSAETAVEDMFIRKFMSGTWHNLFASEIIIKRQHNMIRIGGIITRDLPPRKYYFLIGYTEELLSYWLQCPVKLELQTVESKLSVVYAYK
ncbi:small ribosomal subunit protein uS3m-like [Artemia franciscana]|uniref:small ribosomal subunit protein uS3m-like n=1 Tax=Artemia franciscana TaxID=6661 RepID=UPI0032DAC0A3